MSISYVLWWLTCCKKALVLPSHVICNWIFRKSCTVEWHFYVRVYTWIIALNYGFYLVFIFRSLGNSVKFGVMLIVKVEVFWWTVFWLTLISVTCLLHIYANALMIVLFFCFERCSCLPLAALLVVRCSSVAPVWGRVLGISLLPSLPTYCIVSPTLHWSIASNCSLLWLGWAGAPVVWS
jgi:hypothetical protein